MKKPVDKTLTFADGRSMIDHLRREQKGRRQHNQRSTDSAIAAAIAQAEPELVRAQFRRAMRFLDAHFEAAMDVTGPQAARDVLEQIHKITGERRQKEK